MPPRPALLLPIRMLSVLLLSALLAACAADAPPAFTTPLWRDHPLSGRIWWPAEGRFATVDETVARARAADTVLLGETHDNADHHALQAWMLSHLLGNGRHPLVAFEMIAPEQQPALRRHLADHPGDADGLGAALGWDKSAWPAWGLYRPIAAAALAAGSPLAGANLSHDEVRAIGRGEKSPDLPPLPAEQIERMAHDIRDGHCGMLPETAVPGMVRVQRGRDAVMARTVAEGMKTEGGAVLIAGAGHTRTDHAVPAALAALAPGARVMSLAFIEVRDGETDPAAYGGLFDAERPPFDAVWFTPAAEREDMCAAFRRHLDKKKGG